ncbi:hypothetical protein EGT07_26085 [Herbaspirillum sp. HC18]|nr:hypothetical protein EGT07_26085 [Herbaspirillum sp. HC18]
MARKTMVRFACMASTALAGMIGAAHAQTGMTSETWTYSITPYLWVPGIEGTLKYSLPPGSGNPNVSLSERSFLEALDFAFMLAGEARRGKWSLFGDYNYLKLSTSKSAIRAVDFNPGAPSINPFNTTVNRGTDSSIKGSVLTLGAGYSLARSVDSTFDVVGGVRYLGATAETSWNLSAAVAGPGPGQTFSAVGNASRKVDLWDAVVGIRGRAKLADRWYLPYYLDVGGGSSNMTLLAHAGISYAYRWGELTLAYRHLQYDQDDNKLLQDFKFSGPLLGASFRF